MKILIFGGNGFIGSYLKSFFSNVKKNVVLSVGISDLNEFKVDLTKQSIKINDHFDLIIVCSGIAHNPKHVNNFDKNIISRDLKITNNIINSIHYSTYKKIIFLSSVSVYGRNTGKNIDEKSSIRIINGYSMCKYVSELLYMQNIDYEKLLIFRLPLVVGDNPKGNLNLLYDKVNNGFMVLFSGNISKKSFLEIKDLSRIIAENFDMTGIYNLKSYDKNFNDFVIEYSSINKKKVFFLNSIILKMSLFFCKLLNLKQINSRLIKMTTSLTFSNNKFLNDRNN